MNRPNRGGYINDSVDQFRFLDFRRSLIEAEELEGAQVRSVFQKWLEKGLWFLRRGYR